MADWNLPTLPDPYPDFQDRLKARDIDAITLSAGGVTNPPVNTIWYDRSTNTFRQWNGSSWITLILAAAGGGTGSAAGFPTLGTMATQNANNVAITGGNVTGLSSLGSNGAITAAGAVSGSSIASAGVISAGAHIYTVGAGGHVYVRRLLITGNVDRQLTTADGRIPNFTSAYFAAQQGHEITNLNGSAIDRGSIWVGFIGSGATGSGTKVLLDNGVWTDKNLVGGGVYEIVHNDASMEAGLTTKTFNIPWTRGTPPSKNNVELRLNVSGQEGPAGLVTWFLISATQFNITRITTTATMGYPWTAIWHIVA